MNLLELFWYWCYSVLTGLAFILKGNTFGFQRLEDAPELEVLGWLERFRPIPLAPRVDKSPSTLYSRKSSTSNFPESSGTHTVPSSDIRIIVSGIRWNILERLLTVMSSGRNCNFRSPYCTFTWCKTEYRLRLVIADSCIAHWQHKLALVHKNAYTELAATVESDIMNKTNATWGKSVVYLSPLSPINMCPPLKHIYTLHEPWTSCLHFPTPSILPSPKPPFCTTHAALLKILFPLG